MARRSGTIGFAMTLFATGSTALPLYADAPTDRAAAEALSSAASELMARGEYDQGCAKYQASKCLDPTARRMLLLAECNERRGMTASAWASFGEAYEMAEARGETELARVAVNGVARLDASLGRIEIVVPKAAEVEGLEVRRDGAILPAAAFGVPVPVDPGPHVISARAPGKRPWTSQIGLSQGKMTVTLTMPILESEPSIEVGEARLVSIRPSAAPGGKPDTGKTPRLIGWGLGITGVASLAVGTAMALQTVSTRSDLDSQCRAGICPPAAIDDLEKMRAQATASTVFLGIGAAALVGGAIFYFTAPTAPASERPSAGLRVAPAVGPGTAGIFAVGRF
jgi:hypothetical protein